MPNEVLATEVLAPLPEVALSEPDYRAFCAALEASARGRAFLAEYARRNRHADTATVLAALDRLEALVRRQSASAEADRIRQELRALLAAMRGAQPAIDAGAAAIKAAKLAALIGFVQHRIESIVEPTRAQSALPPEVAALVLMDKELADDPVVEAARSHLAVVPRADEPELPIPAPAAGGPQPPIALVHDPEKHVLDPDRGWEPVFGQDHAQTKQQHAIAPPEQDITSPAPDLPQRSVAIIPEVNLFDGAPATPAAVEPAVAEPAVVATVVTETAAASPPAAFELTLPPPADPLAHIMALSDEERLALFT
jgi:hypothetical protein